MSVTEETFRSLRMPYSSPERLSHDAFRELFTDTQKVIALSRGREAMIFGPSVLPQAEALEEGYIRDSEDFRAELTVGGATGLAIPFDDEVYHGFTAMFRLGGNTSSDPEWLGDLVFLRPDREVKFKFKKHEFIRAERRSDEDIWDQATPVGKELGSELSYSLEQIKKQLHVRKLGYIATR